MEDTIAAVSTAYGEGGIGIVRISGPRAAEILVSLFRGKSGAVTADWFSNRKMRYGHIVDPLTGETVDEVLAVHMKAPHTFTGEDIAEIQCHGSMVSVGKILSLATGQGAIHAEAGEFTKRAFLNGRIDLAQADAVIDLIRAKTETGHRVAMGQLEGRLSGAIGVLRDRLADLLALATVHLDYPDEAEELMPDEIPAANQEIASGLWRIAEDIKRLADTAETGILIRDGIHVVIMGRPNVGKSSLMNTLLRESRAIVTDIPGTTRDTIEAWLNIDGIPIRLTDTAGIRETENPIESLGIRRTEEAASQADLRLLLLDGAAPLEEEDRMLLQKLEARSSAVLITKSDLPAAYDLREAEVAAGEIPILSVSSRTGAGIRELEQLIVSSVKCGSLRQEKSVLITNRIHRDILEKAAREAGEGSALLKSGASLEFAEINIRASYELLGEITGETVTDEILDRVFSRFCVGK